jgi:hypothetical protein
MKKRINMKNLVIEATEDTPYINFNAESCILNIEGNSYSTLEPNVLKQAISWFNDFIIEDKDKLTMNIKLKYFNTSTSKVLLDLIYALDEKFKNGLDVELNWYYNHNYGSIQESGEEFAEEASFPFNFIKAESPEESLVESNEYR